MLNCLRTLVVLLLGLLVGCQSSQVTRLYEGPERAAHEVMVVQVPETLEVMSINDQRPTGIAGRLISDDRDFHLAPGRYQIVAFYKDVWTPLGATTHDVLRSQPVIFDIEGHQGDKFILEYEKPETYEAARKLAGHFSGWSRDAASGERIPTRPSGVARPSLFSAITGDNNEQTSHVAPVEAINTVEPAAHTELAPVVQTPDSHENDNTYLDMLKAYWSQASQEERRAFLQWISK